MNNVFHAQNREMNVDYGESTDLTDKLGGPDFNPLSIGGIDDCVVILGHSNTINSYGQVGYGAASLKYSLNNGNSFQSIFILTNYIFPNQKKGISFYNSQIKVVRANNNYYACFLINASDDNFAVVMDLKKPSNNRAYFLSKYAYINEVNFYYNPEFLETFDPIARVWVSGGAEIDFIWGFCGRDGDLIGFGGGLLNKENSQDSTCVAEYYEDTTWETYNTSYINPEQNRNPVTIPIVAANTKFINFLTPYSYDEHEPATRSFYFYKGCSMDYGVFTTRFKSFSRLMLMARDKAETTNNIRYLNNYYLNSNNEKCFKFMAIRTCVFKYALSPTRIILFDIRIPNTYVDYINSPDLPDIPNSCLQTSQYVKPTFSGGNYSNLIDVYPFDIKAQCTNPNEVFCLYRSEYDVDHNYYVIFLTRSLNGGIDNTIIKDFTQHHLNYDTIQDFYVTKTGRIFTIEYRDKSFDRPAYKGNVVYVSDNFFGTI